jgi:predicted Fe-S protein YdhL (DUF1289 family)
MDTPCINVCVIEPESGHCAGCGRTLSEIAAWSTMTAAQRREIMADLASRRDGSAGAKQERSS